MWITPRPVLKYVSRLWNVLGDLGPFQKLKHKSTGTFLDGVIMRSVNPLEKPALTYRIVVHNQWDGVQYILAVSDSEEVIEKHWKYLKEDLLPLVNSLRYDASNTQSQAREKKPLTEEELSTLQLEDDVVQFLFSKVSSLAQLEEGEEAKNVEAQIEEFHKVFTEVPEKLLTFYSASLWLQYPRNGTVYITENFLCFHSSNLPNKIVLPFEKITSISKESIALGFLNTSIKVATADKQHFFTFISRDEAYTLMENLWKKTMEQRLNVTDIKDGNSAIRQVDSGTSKKMIDDALKNQEFRKIFKLGDEDLLQDFLCSFWRKNTYIVGRLYISHNFVCYHSNFAISGKSLKFIVALNQIETMEKRSLAFGKIQNSLFIQLENKEKIFFLLYSLSQAFDQLNNLWKTRPRGPPENSEVANGWTEYGEYFIEIDPEVEMRQKELWARYLTTHGGLHLSLVQTPKLRILLREGLPDSMRGAMWMVLSGARARMQVKKGYYQDLLKQNENQTSEAVEEIEKDIDRALPWHPYFKNRDNGAVKQLQNVLTAFSWRNSVIGYCQGMNIVAAVMLLYVNEEDAFWLLCTLAEDIIPEYYNKNLLGSQVDQHIFDSLVKANIPGVYKHLAKVGLPLSLISLPWFMCLFMTYVPWKSSLRLLDCFFYDGPNVLLQAGLAILQLNESEILKLDDSQEIITLVRERHYEDGNILMKTIFTDFGFLPVERINELRNKQKFEAIRNIEESRKKKILHELQRTSQKFDTTEMDSIYEKFRSVLAYDALDFQVDMEECQQLFEHYLLPSQSNWWDFVLPKLFKVFHTNPYESKLTFLEFLSVLGIFMKGSLQEKFEICFKLCDADDDGKITRGEFEKMLNILHRMLLKNEPQENFAGFADMIMSKIHRDKEGILAKEDIKEAIIDKPLLASFWNLEEEEKKVLQ